MELRSNACYGMFDEDVVDHIAKVLKILNLIKIPNMDTYRLRGRGGMKVFSLSKADDCKTMVWIDEGDGKIITWEELVEKFFFKFYLLYRDGKDEMLDKEPMDDIVSSNDEWEESDYGNRPNTYTNTESLFKPYLDAHEKSSIGKEDERSRKKCKGNNSKLEIIPNKAPKFDNMNNEHPNKRDLAGKEIDKVGEVSINLEYLLMKLTIENLSSIYQGSFSF
ncbi:hypothetical protein Tco_1129416 [Tanacetum coccineum]